MKSLTFRLLLLMLASGLGLWLGAGSRSAAAGKVTVQRENPGKSLIADAFSFNILMARAELAEPQTVQSTRPAAPAAVVVAQSEPVETVEAPVRVALQFHPPGPLGIHPLAPPRVRPAGAWQIRVEGQMARLRQTENQVQVILRGLPGLKLAERERFEKKLQCELQRASRTLETLTLDEPAGGPEPPALPEVPVQDAPGDAVPNCGN